MTLPSGGNVWRANQETMDHFYFLLEKYLSGSLDAEEELVFMEMIRSGVYDTLLKQKIEEEFRHGTASRDMSPDRAKELFYKLLYMERRTREMIPARRRLHPALWIGIAATVLCLLGGWWFMTGPQKGAVKNTKTETAAVTSLIEKHGRQFIRLPDGSTVILNANSQLSYPDSFPGDTREVSMTGEGYFDIHPEAGRLFIVHANGIDITVLGTAFNIKAYPSEGEVTVTVTRGKVKVSSKKQSYGIAVSNQQIAVNIKDGTFSQMAVNADRSIGWKKQYLILDNLNMTEAAALIGNKYHVNVLLADDSLKRYNISATFLNNESLEQVLTVVCGVINATYILQPNDQVIIKGK